MAQRGVTMADAPEVIEVFSQSYASASAVTGVPVYPAAAHPTITVNHAAGGSGMVTFKLDGEDLMPLSDDEDSPEPNSEMSIPAGTTADDASTLTLIYKPSGEMGAGEFEIRLPSGWDAENILTLWAHTAGDDDVTRSGQILTVTLPEGFGMVAADALEIELEGISAPNRHGNHRFIARSKSEGASLGRLSPAPMVFVGNTKPDHDTVAVEISPAAVYQGEGVEEGTADKESVDFEIRLKASGPMYDSTIYIETSADLDDVQDDSTTGKGYVRKKGSAGRNVDVTADPDGRNINIAIGELDTDEVIIVSYENVDIPLNATPGFAFNVFTRTRAPEGGFDSAGGDFARIEPDPDTDEGGITTGEIRTVAGSGKMAISPQTVEKDSGNNRFTLTYTAATDLTEATLEIVLLKQLRPI